MTFITPFINNKIQSAVKFRNSWFLKPKMLPINRENQTLIISQIGLIKFLFIDSSKGQFSSNSRFNFFFCVYVGFSSESYIREERSIEES